jgi:hypothetical protein
MGRRGGEGGPEELKGLRGGAAYGRPYVYGESPIYPGGEPPRGSDRPRRAIFLQSPSVHYRDRENASRKKDGFAVTRSEALTTYRFCLLSLLADAIMPRDCSTRRRDSSTILLISPTVRLLCRSKL